MTMILMLSLLGLASAECVLESAESTSDSDAQGWSRTESWKLNVQTGHPTCRRFVIRLAPEMRIEGLRAVLKQWDDSRIRLGAERLVMPSPALHSEVAILEMPEVRPGDRLTVRVVRAGDGPEPPERSESWWRDARPILSDAEVANPHAKSETKIALHLPHSGEVRFGADGNVGALYQHRTGLDGAPARTAEWSTFGEAAGVLQMQGSQVLEISGDGLRLTGDGPGMEISKDGWLRFVNTDGVGVASWRVISARGQSVISGRQDVLSQIAAGALAASIPEPGLGIAFKGRDADWSVVDEVLAHSRRQVIEGQLSSRHPLKPRKLHQVRRSRWATPWEHALLLTRYLRQLKIDALPVPVRPLSDGRIEPAVPDGYAAATVRIRIDGEERWVDPSCGVCAVGEVRPGLWGGQALSAEISALPEQAEARWEQSHTDGAEVRNYTLVLTAPWSVSLRQHLARAAVEQRPAAILGWVGIDGARLVSHDRIGELGSPIQLQLEVPLTHAAEADEALEARRASP